jgi:hypothetical protein
VKKTTLLLFAVTMIFLISQVQGVEWILYSKNTDDDEFFYDRENLTKPSRGIIKVWEKTKFSEKSRSKYIQEKISDGSSVNGYDTLSYQLGLVEINCSEREQRLTKVSQHSSNGQVLFTHTYNQKPSQGWIPISPQSVSEIKYNAVCPPQEKK